MCALYGAKIYFANNLPEKNRVGKKPFHVHMYVKLRS